MTSPRDALACNHSLASLDAEVEFLTANQAAAEDLMLGMRMARGADPGLLQYARQLLGEAALDDAVRWCQARGLAQWEDGRLVPTHDGWLMGNELYGALWDLAEGTPITSETS